MKFFLYVGVLFCTLFGSIETTPYKYDLSVVAIFQNEAECLREWIEFHLLMGVKHFYLYSNNSTDNYKEVLNPYIKKGIVELIEWPSVDNTWDSFCYSVQPRAYTHAIKKSKTETEWLAIIDVDEFLFSPCESTIINCLNKYFSDCAGVFANWQIYGTSRVKKIPDDKLKIETLLCRAEVFHARNIHGKSIVKPQYVRRCGNPHYVTFRAPHSLVDTNKEPYQLGSVYVDKLRINHYWTGDEDHYFNVKIPRYRQFNPDKPDYDFPETLLQEYNQVVDSEILKFVPQLRKRMGLDDEKNYNLPQIPTKSQKAL